MELTSGKCAMDRFPCSCGGENPNCFRCFGTGLIDRPASVGRPHPNLSEMARQAALKPKVSAKSKKGRKKPKQVIETRKAALDEASGNAKPGVSATYSDGNKLVICSHCGVEVRASRMADHVQRVHKASAVVSYDHIKSALPAGKARCPTCMVVLYLKNLERHLRKVHQEVIQTPSRGSSRFAATGLSSSSGSLPPNVVKCPRCPVVAPDQRSLFAHLRFSHGEQLGDIKNTQSHSAVAGSQGDVRPAGGGRGESAMDGSYGWGTSFRDNGQFGSYPSFDPMDDESSS